MINYKSQKTFKKECKNPFVVNPTNNNCNNNVSKSSSPCEFVENMCPTWLSKHCGNMATAAATFFCLKSLGFIEECKHKKPKRGRKGSTGRRGFQGFQGNQGNPL